MLEEFNVPFIEDLKMNTDLLEKKLKGNRNFCRVYLLVCNFYKKDLIKIYPELISKNLNDISRPYAYELLMEFVYLELFNKHITHKGYGGKAIFTPAKPINDIITQRYIDIAKEKLNLI